MSGPLHSWYSLQDLQALARRAAILGGEIELRRFERLLGLLNDGGGSVRASLQFRQHPSGWLVVELECEALLELVCQRCLEPMNYPLSQQLAIALLESASMEPHVPEGFDTLVLDGERLMPAELIEDELIICLPLVPRHADAERCSRAGSGFDHHNPTGPASTHRSPPTSH